MIKSTILWWWNNLTIDGPTVPTSHKIVARGNDRTTARLTWRRSVDDIHWSASTAFDWQAASDLFMYLPS